MRANSTFVKVQNDANAIATIKQMRAVAKTVGMRVDVRGRCKQRKAVFAITGRYYSTRSANVNDIYLGSAEAPFCHEWAIYIRNKRS